MSTSPSDRPGGPWSRSWATERLEGSAAELHERLVPEPAGRQVWVLRVDRPALVLGSAQPASHADRTAAARAGVEVVRRRGGGGAVLLRPGESVWVDVVIARDDPLWDDDVGRATWWLGGVWAEALAARGVAAPLAVHHGPLERAAWSERVCFAGTGAGEVAAGGRKVVGISQRRTRQLARFQCAALLHWDPQPLVELLDLTERQRRDCLAAVWPRAVGLDELVTPDGGGVGGDAVDELVAQFLSALGRATT